MCVLHIKSIDFQMLHLQLPNVALAVLQMLQLQFSNVATAVFPHSALADFSSVAPAVFQVLHQQDFQIFLSLFCSNVAVAVSAQPRFKAKL